MASSPASARAWRLVKERRVIVPPIRGEASFGRPVTPSLRGRGGCGSTPPGAGYIRVTIGRGGTGNQGRQFSQLAARLDGATAKNPLSGLHLSHGIRSGSLLPELLGEPQEDPFGTADVAEPIRVLILDHFADDRRAAFAEPGERVVDVLHGEHDAQVTESVHRGVAVIGGHGR